MNSIHDFAADTANKFIILTETLSSLTETSVGDKKLISSCFKDLNKLDYRSLTIKDNNEIVALISQLQRVIQPTETLLVKNTCCLLRNLICNNINFGTSCETTIRWLLHTLQCSQPQAQNDILLTLQDFLRLGKYNTKSVCTILFGDKGHLMRFLILQEIKWSDSTLTAMWCLAVVLEKQRHNSNMSATLADRVKNIVLNIISSQQSAFDLQCYDKILHCSLRILRIIIEQKYITNTANVVGQMLGVVQVFLFHGIKDYEPMTPQVLHPAAMNLPEPVHVIPKCKNLKNHRIRSKKETANKDSLEVKNNVGSEQIALYKQSSDSDTSDSEHRNSVYTHSTVRLESVHLLKALIDNSQNRELFGFWPQIVAIEGKSNARVLIISILKEPVSIVRRSKLSALAQLLIGARPFLIHAEDDEHMSFTTFFYTVSCMIKELHSSLSLVINTERNAAVLTQTLICAAALIDGTPYARLRTGLITRLIKSCKLHISHKDPTVRVAALSVFEILASCDPVTPEIFNILAEPYGVESTIEKLIISASSPSDLEISDQGTEAEEIDATDQLNGGRNNLYENHILTEKGISSVVHICLKNISNKTMILAVRLQSLKLIGRMAFTTGKLIFSYVEIVTKTLMSVLDENETQVVLHATRGLEIMAGCLSGSEYNDTDVVLFWNIIFDKLIALTSHTETVLREAACDCLGNIDSNMVTRRKTTIRIITTTLFGAVLDEKSGVRAAAVRALGMLVALRSLGKRPKFLMDVAYTVFMVSIDQNLGVRVKGAWTLANLCDYLAELRQNDNIEPVPFDIVLPNLYDVSVKATRDNDKVKCNAVRAVGTILHLCADREILKNTSLGLNALITCATTGPDMKVRWNACRALGLVLSRDPESMLPSSWKDCVFPALCTLVYQSPNFKVRTNAAWALSTTNLYGKYTVSIWESIILAFENVLHVPSYVEYPHREALVQQLCLTLSHVGAYTKESELQPLWTILGEHIENISSYMKHFQETVLPEKTRDFIKAAAQMEQFAKSAPCEEERQIARMLVNIFERPKYCDSLDGIAS